MTDKSRMFNGNKSATDVVSKAFEKFKEFSTAASGQSYAEFLNKFKNKGLTTWQGSSKPTDSNFLSGLYLCSTSYFRHQHQKKAAQARPPSSIREMLYWLMGLTATPQFGDLLGHIHNVVGDYFKVAVSGSSKKDETLSADQVTSYILSTCYTAPSVLDIIQGRVPPNGSKDEPWLHRLYSNADFNYTYPSSGAALFYALSNYTYALQFQLGFLYQQCSQLYVNTCGWFMCTYGKGVNPIGSNGKVVSSHICPVGCSNPNHTSDDYNSHKSTYCQHAECGTSASKPSPLQAFLTDNLKGFSRGHPSGHSDHLAACSSHTCHVPMGFESHIRADGKYQGGHISPTLKGFCGSSNTPLCHLSETLTCLSKRTPRTLGDLFGFLWHLNGQLFHNTRPTLQALAKKLVDAIGKNNSPKVPGFLFNILKNVAQSLPSSGPSPSGLSLSLESMAPTIPFLYQLFMLKEEYFLPTKLYDLNGSTHQHSHKDLYSISACRNGPNENCGEYLSPLCYSTGSAFAPHHASSYFSWVLYLTDDLETGLQEMLDEFKNIDCKKSGCHGDKCQGDHGPGQHGSSPTCQCDSVVHCGGVLPLIYSNGFIFASAYSLKGGQSSGKKTCQNFHDQLSAVLAQNENTPLFKLLTTIDDLLYLFRIYFFYNLSTFWIMYVCIVLYMYFLRADLLHLKSHLRLPSSHGLPSISLLTTGKPSVLTKFTKLTYFTP